MNRDKLLIQGMSYDCQIGFFESEQGILQRLLIDIEAEADPMLQDELERADRVRMDYFKANQLVTELLAGRKFNLIETVGEIIAQALLKRFSVQSVRVTVTKFPIDMPNVRSVSCVCTRFRKA